MTSATTSTSDDAATSVRLDLTAPIEPSLPSSLELVTCLVLALPPSLLFYVAASRAAGSLHANYRLLLIALGLGVLGMLVLHAADIVALMMGNDSHHWLWLTFRTNLFLMELLFPVILLERILATVFYRRYESATASKIFSPIAISFMACLAVSMTVFLPNNGIRFLIFGDCQDTFILGIEPLARILLSAPNLGFWSTIVTLIGMTVLRRRVHTIKQISHAKNESISARFQLRELRRTTVAVVRLCLCRLVLLVSARLAVISFLNLPSRWASICPATDSTVFPTLVVWSLISGLTALVSIRRRGTALGDFIGRCFSYMGARRQVGKSKQPHQLGFGVHGNHQPAISSHQVTTTSTAALTATRSYFDMLQKQWDVRTPRTILPPINAASNEPKSMTETRSNDRNSSMIMSS